MTVMISCAADRELAMLLSMAQSNPALFQMISDRVTLARQLDKLRKLKELMETSQEELKAKQAEDWRGWITRYRSVGGVKLELSDCNGSKSKIKLVRPKVEGGAPAWTGFGRMMSGSANDSVEDAEKKEEETGLSFCVITAPGSVWLWSWKDKVTHRPCRKRG